MKDRKNYRDLLIWQKADALFDMVCHDVASWPASAVANSIKYQLGTSKNLPDVIARSEATKQSPRVLRRLLRSRWSLAMTNGVFRGAQLLDAAGSVGANIAEGYGRGLPREFEQFLRYSRGSSAEAENWLFKAMKQALISEEQLGSYERLIDELGKMTAAFIGRLRGQSPRKDRPK